MLNVKPMRNAELAQIFHEIALMFAVPGEAAKARKKLSFPFGLDPGETLEVDYLVCMPFG